MEIPSPSIVNTPPKTVPQTHLTELRLPLPSSQEFRDFVSNLQSVVDKRIDGPIFHADLNLPSTFFNYFLSHFPTNLQLEHTCTTCRLFLNCFGDLCQVQDDGTLRPLIWPEDINGLPEIYRVVTHDIHRLFAGKVVGKEYRVVKDELRYLGIRPSKDDDCWIHFNFHLKTLPLSALDYPNTETSYNMLSRVLMDHTVEVINKAHHLLHDKLPRADPHKSTINWLKHVAEKINQFDGGETEKQNLLTRYSRAPQVGYLSSLRGGIIGTLLQDVSAELDYEKVEERWSVLSDGLAYLRPRAAPRKGNIATAEKIFAQFGYAKEDLIRYFLTADEVPESAILWKDPALWNVSADSPASAPRIFSSLLPPSGNGKAGKKTFHEDTIAPTSMSLRTFARTILPTAKSLKVLVPEETKMGFFTTGAPGSKSPFIWGSETNRASHYVWGGARAVTSGGLVDGWNSVTAIVSFPYMWEYISPKDALDFEPARTYEEASSSQESSEERKLPHSKLGVRFLFVLPVAKDTATRGLCLFPEALRGEFHGSRRTVEAFSEKESIAQPLDGKSRQHIGGMVGRQSDWEVMHILVEMESGISTRFDLELFF